MSLEVALAQLFMKSYHGELQHSGACAVGAYPGDSRSVTTHLEPSSERDRERAGDRQKWMDKPITLRPTTASQL